MESLVLPNAHALAVLVLVGIALVLYSRDYIAYETTSLAIAVTLMVGFTLFPYQGADGPLLASEFLLSFGNRGLIAVCALMILGQGLISTGALDPMGALLSRYWRVHPRAALLVMMLFTFTLSCFVNDTPVVVMLLPILLGVAARTGMAPSSMLMPMGFATILGGMTTTIGTSTNLLVVNVAADMGMDPLQIFSWAGASLIGGLAGIAWIWLAAPRLLPDREVAALDTARRFTAQIRLDAPGVTGNWTLADAIARTHGDLKVESIQRGRDLFITPLPDVRLRTGDYLLTSDTQQRLREYCRLLDGTLFSGDRQDDARSPLNLSGAQLAEVAVTPDSQLIGLTVEEARARAMMKLEILGVRHYAQTELPRSRGFTITSLSAGDVLLVQGRPEDLAQLSHGSGLLLLDGTITLPATRLAPVALLTMGGVIALAVARILPIEVSSTLGCMLLIVTRCLSWQQVVRALSAKVILIIATSLMLGTALVKTGGSDYLAGLFIWLTFGAPAWVPLMLLMLLVALLTNVVSNNAAAVIGTPIAIGIAQRLGMPLEPFVLAVIFGANLSFATPMAYQTNLLLMSAANYRFSDFVRLGLPLSLGLWIILSLVLIHAYGL